MKFLEKIFSIKNSELTDHKVLTMMGLRIKFKRRKTLRELLEHNRIAIIQGVQRSITTATLHQKTFSEYKNIYQGKDVVLMGAGPTLKDFQPPSGDKVIYVGANRAFKFEKVKFDYLFSIDKVGIDIFYEEFLAYEGNNCTKFIGDQNLGAAFQIPESYILKLKNIRRYKSTAGYLPDKFAYDITTEPLGNFATVTLQAIQFILYTNPKRIYLVGIDCTVATKGHFCGKSYDTSERNQNPKQIDNSNIKYWTDLKEFAKIYYPETEIISINPVGLKGIFRDIFTTNGEEE